MCNDEQPRSASWQALENEIKLDRQVRRTVPGGFVSLRLDIASLRTEGIPGAGGLADVKPSLQGPVIRMGDAKVNVG